MFSFLEKQVILAATAPMHSVMAVMNLATLQRTAPAKFPPQEHHTTKTDLIQGIGIPTPGVKDHTPPIMVPDMGDISAGHSPVAIATVTRAAVSEGTHYTPHPATTAAHTTLWLMDVPITIHTVTHPTGVVVHHPALATSPTDVTHATIPQNRAGLTPETPTGLHRNHSQELDSYPLG